jgi:hypothetical protein
VVFLLQLVVVCLLSQAESLHLYLEWYPGCLSLHQVVYHRISNSRPYQVAFNLLLASRLFRHLDKRSNKDRLVVIDVERKYENRLRSPISWNFEPGSRFVLRIGSTLIMDGVWGIRNSALGPKCTVLLSGE